MIPEAHRDIGGEREADGESRIPIGVFQGILDIEKGNTASKEDIESALKF